MDSLKLGATVVFTALFTWLGASLPPLIIPVTILVILNLLDYVTGLCAAKYRNPTAERPISSDKSMKGIIKKACIYVVIIIGFLLDYIIDFGIVKAGVELNFPPMITIIVCAWFIFNEMLSIVENLDDIGVKMPPFLKPLLKAMKKQANIEVKKDK